MSFLQTMAVALIGLATVAVLASSSQVSTFVQSVGQFLAQLTTNIVGTHQ